MTQIPGKCYSLCNHLNEQCCGLNLKIYCVTCPDTIRTQNGVHIPILYRILRFIQDIPPILQLENILIQLRDKTIYLWTSTKMDTVDLLAAFTAWLEESPKGLAAPENVCRSVSLSCWDIIKILLKCSCLRPRWVYQPDYQ